MTQKIKKLNKSIFFVVGVPLLILTTGFFIAHVVGLIETELQKNKFEKVAMTISSTIDQKEFENIASTADDNSNEYYLDLRSKLIEVGKINKEQGVRWIYTFIPRGEDLVFSVDSITDENHSEPGDKYEDASPEFIKASNRVWNNKETVFIEPYTDQWGTFVSILTPVLHNDKVVSILGIDVDYNEYFLTEINKSKNIWYQITFFVLILFIIFYARITYLHKKTEEEKVEKTRLQFALEGAGDGLWDWNLSENTVYYSDRWKEILGYPDNYKYTALSTREMIHPDDYDFVTSTYAEHIAGITKKHELIYRSKTGNGEYKWILDRAKVVEYDQNLKPSRIVGTIADLDKLKKTEIELQRKIVDFEKIKTASLNVLQDVATEKEKFQEISRKLELAASCAEIGVLELDLQANLIFGDEIICKMYEVEKKHFNGISFSEWQTYVHSDDLEKVKNEMSELILKNKPFVSTFRIKTNSGKIKHIKAFATLKKDTEGKAVRMVGINMDITKDFEIDKAKTEFVSLASHQLKTPVGAIGWNLEMLLAGDYGKISKKQKEIIEEVYSMNRRMADLVNSFLNISRIELGTLAVEPESINFGELAEEILLELNQKIIEKKQKITKIFEQIDDSVADKKLLSVIFQNLLSNAVKYCPDEGEIELKIAKQGKEINISVKNSGNPIPKQDQSKIFERLFRASNAQNIDPNGNGLGLYLVKSIVEVSGGKISFESSPESGTIFNVVYPYPGMIKRVGSKHIS